MMYFIIFAVITFLIYSLLKSSKDNQNNISDNKPYIRDVTLTRHHSNPMMKAIQEDFTPYKIVENDNTLHSIVSDFEDRKLRVREELKDKLGSALTNDVLWGLLQDLYSEYFFKDHKIFLNTTYQQGLLLQKEKKYKQAISHYSYGLYYLMNVYQVDFNPTAHLIDFVQNDIQVIEMAQQKFINKIQLCAKYERLKEDEIKKYASKLITISTLTKLSFDDFFEIIKDYTVKNDSSIDDNTIGNMQDKPFFEDDAISHLKFNATLQLRTPLSVLVHHGEIFKENGKVPPNYAKEEWQGIWITKTKSYIELGLYIDEIPSGTVSTDIGSVEEDEAKDYLEFLIKFHTISESEIDVEEKIIKIKHLYKSDANFKKYYIRQTGDKKDFLESYFKLLIRNVLPSNIANSFKEAGYRTLKDLKGANPKDLLSLKNVGHATISKLKKYF